MLYIQLANIVNMHNSTQLNKSSWLVASPSSSPSSSVESSLIVLNVSIKSKSSWSAFECSAVFSVLALRLGSENSCNIRSSWVAIWYIQPLALGFCRTHKIIINSNHYKPPEKLSSLPLSSLLSSPTPMLSSSLQSLTSPSSHSSISSSSSSSSQPSPSSSSSLSSS